MTPIAIDVDTRVSIDRSTGTRTRWATTRRRGRAAARLRGRPSPVVVGGVAMLCAISGTTPTNAVVTPGGVVYDKTLIVKAIEVRRRDDECVCGIARD